jgi:hypothetical protein
MPDYSASLSVLRQDGHRLACYASFYVGDVILSGVIDSVATLPVGKAGVSGGFTGDYTDVKPGMRVGIYTSGGALKGFTRTTFDSGGIAEFAIYTRAMNLATLDIAVGDTVKVFKDIPLSDKLPSSNFFAPEGQAYITQNSDPAPIPCSGGAWAGWDTMLPIPMTGDTSRTLDPDSTSGVSHVWNSDGLTYASGTSTAANPQLTGAAGKYLVGHTATDIDNSQSKNQYVPVVIHDANNPPYEVIVDSLPNSEERGGSASVRFLEPVLLSDVPDGALCILWKEEYIAEVRQSVGARSGGRSHILFVGYLRRESGELHGADGSETLTFDLISPLTRLDEFMGYGRIMLAEATVDDWNKFEIPLYLSRAIAQLLMAYSTVAESGHDVIFTDTFVDEEYSGFFVQQSTPMAQIRELADATDGRVIEDRRGRFEIQMRPEYVALGDRGGLTVTLTLQPQDILDFKYTREHWRPMNRVEVRAFSAGMTGTPFFSMWPGDAPGLGNRQTVVTRKIVTATGSQIALNARAGRIGAALDGIYTDADNVVQMAYDLELRLRGVYDLFDLYDEVVEINVQTTLRGLDFSEHLYVFVSSQVTFQGGTVITTARFRTCTNGAAGVTYTPPAENSAPAP